MDIHDLELTLYEEKPKTIKALKIIDVGSVECFQSANERHLVKFETDNNTFYDVTDITRVKPNVGDYIIMNPESFDWTFKRKTEFEANYKEA